MSRYIYCNGKIYDERNYAKLKIYLGEEIDNIDLKNKYRLVGLPYEDENIKTVLEHMNSYIEFDYFDDLIEVGDIVKYEKVQIYMNTYSELTINVNFEVLQDEWHLANSQCYNINEIYKHIGKDFIRVCHKKSGKWVID